MEDALPWAWQALRPIYTDGSVVNEAAGLRQELALPAMPSIPADVYAGLGLGPDDLVVIRRVLAAYDHTNAMAVLALTALRARLDGRVPQDATAAGPMPTPGTPRIPLPKLLDLAEMPPGIAAIVTELNGFGEHVSPSRTLAVLSVLRLATAGPAGQGRPPRHRDRAGPTCCPCAGRPVVGPPDRFHGAAATGAGCTDQRGARAVRRRRHCQNAGDLRVPAPCHGLGGKT